MDASKSKETGSAKKRVKNEPTQNPIIDEPQEKEVQDALKTVGSFEFLKETKASTEDVENKEPVILRMLRDVAKNPKSKRRKSVPKSNVTKIMPEDQRLELKKWEDERKAQKKLEKAQKQHEAEHAAKSQTPHVRNTGKRKIDETESPSRMTKGAAKKKLEEEYKKMKEAGKRKVQEDKSDDNDYIEVSEEEEKTGKEKEDEDSIEVINVEKNQHKKAKMYQTLRPKATAAPLSEAMRN